MPISNPSPLKDLSCAVLQCFGLTPYDAILQLQHSLHAARSAGSIPDTWLVGEHPIVVTQGVRARESDLLASSSALAGAPVVKIDRGGMTTLHSPGQLVLYPIVALAEGSLGAGAFSRALVSAMREWIASEFGIQSRQRDGHPGLFVEGRKLLSIGISVRGGVAMHGVALNLANDLSLWSGIVPCGAPDIQPVSVSGILGRKVIPSAHFLSMADWLSAHWGYGEVMRVLESAA